RAHRGTDHHLAQRVPLVPGAHHGRRHVAGPPQLVVPRTLSGRMSVQTVSMWSRQAALEPRTSSAVQPPGTSRCAGQMEYCSSWFLTTTYSKTSSVDAFTVIPPLSVSPARGPSV